MPSSASVVVIDALEKLRPHGFPVGTTSPLAAIAGEVVMVQIAYQADGWEEYDRVECALRIDCPLPVDEVSLVRLVPCELPSYPAFDGGYLSTTPTLLPDRLESAEVVGARVGGARARFLPNYWQTALVELQIPVDTLPGDIPFTVDFVREDGETHASASGIIQVQPGARVDQLPAFPRSEWFHVDSLAEAYELEMWSDAHWEAIETYVATMTAHGVTALLTPLLTPPLDTQVGGYRRLAQLVDIDFSESVWSFDFSRLDRWLLLASRQQVQLIEFAPLFTQWGAAHAPQVVATVEGEKDVRVFGWETQASGEAYTTFLEALLTAVMSHLAESGWAGRFFFHVSDEPGEGHAAEYRRAIETVRRAVGATPIRDATVHVELYLEGVVTSPIAGLETVADFVEAGAADAWAYTSCAHHVDLPNAFIALSGSRCRMVGVALFLAGARGYLRWGYNFWFSQHSKRFVDPRMETSAGLAFPSGDPFLVYPGLDLQPQGSLRLKYLRQAMEDVRLLLKVEEARGREAALQLIRDAAGRSVSIDDYPDDPEFFRRLRSLILRALLPEPIPVLEQAAN